MCSPTSSCLVSFPTPLASASGNWHQSGTPASPIWHHLNQSFMWSITSACVVLPPPPPAQTENNLNVGFTRALLSSHYACRICTSTDTGCICWHRWNVFENKIRQLFAGVHPEEVVHCWLTDLRFQVSNTNKQNADESIHQIQIKYWQKYQRNPDDENYVAGVLLAVRSCGLRHANHIQNVSSAAVS